MDRSAMEHRDIIEALAHKAGGGKLLAARLGVSESRISKWKLMGIPARRWPEVHRLCRALGLKRISFRDIEEGSPLCHKRDCAA